MSFKVAIVGRPNVGKSSLFNRLIGERKAVEDKEAGSTRDRLYGRLTWQGKQITLIDTGGLEFTALSFEEEIKYQVEVAVLEADLVLFLVSAKAGLTKDDLKISQLLRKYKKPTIVVVNMVDNANMLLDTYEFYNLGCSELFPVSAQHGIGTGDLLDKINSFNQKEQKSEQSNSVKVCIIGKPNVGKSSLINKIVGHKRLIESSIAGATHDAVDVTYRFNEKEYVFVDTAGIRRPSKVVANNERYSVLLAMSALSEAQIAVLVIDAANIEVQDEHVAGLLKEDYKACLVVVNKWDLVEKTKTKEEFKREFFERFNFLEYAEIVFVSCLENKKVHTIFPKIEQIYANAQREIPTSTLNNILAEITFKNPPKQFNNGQAKFNYCTQIKTFPTVFLLFVNNPQYVHFSYIRHFSNEFRKYFDFSGVPLKFEVRRKGADKLWK